VLNKVADYFPKLIDWLKKIWEMLKEVGTYIRESFLGALKGKAREQRIEDIRKEYEKDVSSILGRKPRSLSEAYNQQTELKSAALVKQDIIRKKLEGGEGTLGGYLGIGREVSPEELAYRTRDITRGIGDIEEKKKALATAMATLKDRPGGSLLPALEKTDPEGLLTQKFLQAKTEGGRIAAVSDMRSAAIAYQENTEATKKHTQTQKESVEALLKLNSTLQTSGKRGGDARKHSGHGTTKPGATEAGK